jgi:hypothetical protein
MEAIMKKLFLALVVFVALGLAFSVSAQTQVLTGTWKADVNTEGYTLAENQGDRSVVISVEFLEPFENKPDVMLSVTFLDATSDKNVRYKVESMSVSRDAMTIKISTWSDTKIMGIRGFWIAHSK